MFQCCLFRNKSSDQYSDFNTNLASKENSIYDPFISRGIYEYQILKTIDISKEQLKQGQYGIIRTANHRNTQLLRIVTDLKKDYARLSNDIAINKQLDHPNILRIYDSFITNQNTNIIMEYLEGGELFERIKVEGQFSEQIACKYIFQILSALSYCHNQQLYHFDIKPENIYFTSNQYDCLKISNLHIVKISDENQQRIKHLNSKYFIAPELIHDQFTETSDIWSCGVLLYIMIFGYPPFNGPDDKSIQDKILSGECKFDEQISTIQAKEFIQKLLKIDPKQRLTAKQALNDQWLLDMVKNDFKPAPFKYNGLRYMQQNILKIIIQQIIMSSQLTNQIQQFISYDQDRDGLIKQDNLQIKEIFHPMLFSTFVAQFSEVKQFITPQNIYILFKLIDKDKNGIITKPELEEYGLQSLCDSLDVSQFSQNKFIETIQNLYIDY